MIKLYVKNFRQAEIPIREIPQGFLFWFSPPILAVGYPKYQFFLKPAQTQMHPTKTA